MRPGPELSESALVYGKGVKPPQYEEEPYEIARGCLCAVCPGPPRLSDGGNDLLYLRG